MLVMFSAPAGFSGTASANGESALAALVADPMSILAMRSPGARGANALVQTKAPYVQGKGGPEDYLGFLAEPDAPTDAGGASSDDVNAVDQAPVLSQLGEQSSFLPPLGFPDGDNGIAFFPRNAFGGDPEGFFFAGGGGGGGGTVNPGAQPLPQAPSVVPTQTAAVSSVPEPRAWLMMISGFLFVGQALRSQGRGKTRKFDHSLGTLPVVPKS